MGKNKSVMDVLIIEDQEDVIETMEIYLENMGCFRNIVKSVDGAPFSEFYWAEYLRKNMQRKTTDLISKHSFFPCYNLMIYIIALRYSP